MKAAIIPIGNELLGGYALDSNSTWIGRKLTEIGIKTVFRISVRDSIEDIQEALQISSDKADVVLCTGGLGPTNDDVTKQAFCSFVGAKLIFDEGYFQRLEARFEKKGRTMPESNREQAYVPDKGEVIPNPIGSARGIKYKTDATRYYIMPGVPAEMKGMMGETVIPDLADISTEDLIVSTIRITGLMESALYDLLSDLVEETKVEVSFIPGFMGVDIRLTSRDSVAVMELSSVIYDRVGSYVYAEDWETLEEVVGRLLKENGLTVAVAESCTGGLLADRLTNVPGSSDYFLGGVVTYSNESKMSLLGVKNETLVSRGAVSAETAVEMAAGARAVLQSEIGISITGIAGPTGGTPGKPVGLTFIGLDYAGDCEVNRYVFSDERRFNKELAAQAALNMMRLAIE